MQRCHAVITTIWRQVHSCSDNDPSGCLGSRSDAGRKKRTSFSLPVIELHFRVKALLLCDVLEWWLQRCPALKLRIKCVRLRLIVYVLFLTDKRDDLSCHKHGEHAEWLVFTLCLWRCTMCVCVCVCTHNPLTPCLYAFVSVGSVLCTSFYSLRQLCFPWLKLRTRSHYCWDTHTRAWIQAHISCFLILSLQMRPPV